MLPEGQDLQENIIFEVLTLCGSNRFKKFLIVSEKPHFKNITFHGNAPDLSILDQELSQIWCISMKSNILKMLFLGNY